MAAFSQAIQIDVGRGCSLALSLQIWYLTQNLRDTKPEKYNSPPPPAPTFSGGSWQGIDRIVELLSARLLRGSLRLA